MNNLFLEKAIIRDNAALIDSQTLISIAEVKPIGISDLEPTEKLELCFQYQYFLRSLTFPIQVVLRLLNKDCEKYLYRKRMADVEETIKTSYKRNYKDVLSESEEFKTWLKHFLEMNARPALLCYLVVAVHSSTDLAKNRAAYAWALQLLDQRMAHCISRLSSIKFKKKTKANTSRSNWEKEEEEKIQEKKAMIAFGMFKKSSGYYSLNDFGNIKNGKQRIRDFIKNNFFEEIIAEKELSLQVERLSEKRMSNLFDSYCKDFVLLNKNGLYKYYSLRDLFDMWVR